MRGHAGYQWDRCHSAQRRNDHSARRTHSSSPAGNIQHHWCQWQCVRRSDRPNGNYVTATNPAKRGQNYYLVATGLGQVTPATATDRLGVNGQNVNFQVIVGVSGLGVPVFEQIYQPDAVGIYIIGFTIPLTNPTGVDQPLALAVTVNGQIIFGNPVFLNSVQ